MIVEPKVKGFICAAAHPTGCRESVSRQIEYVKRHGRKEGPKRILIIGASTGYGLASRIATTYTYGAATIGIMYEKAASDKRTATPGYYNTKAFEEMAEEEGYFAKTINGDAFQKQTKVAAIEMIKENLGQVDMIIYSLASPRRTDAYGITYTSVLKTVKEPFTNKTLDLRNNQISEVTIAPASKEEEAATVKVMGGEDWEDWVVTLEQAGVLSPGIITIAYSYIGPKLTYPIYKDGTIGSAKKHLYDTSLRLTKELSKIGGKAYIAVNKALVTQASAAIPVVPLYISILYQVMKEQKLHEGCIEQMDRLFYDKLMQENVPVDELLRIRMDDYEMYPEVQSKVEEAWENVTTENVMEYVDILGYWEDFYHMFGFHYENIDYSLDVEV